MRLCVAGEQNTVNGALSYSGRRYYVRLTLVFATVSHSLDDPLKFLMPQQRPHLGVADVVPFRSQREIISFPSCSFP